MQINTKHFRVSSQVWNKREFNPTDRQDLDEYRYFLQNQNWRNGCPFVVEWPYLNVVDMIQNKIIEQHLDRIITQSK